jgi:serine phosphatase RsbU (regulator of sigma subunit)
MGLGLHISIASTSKYAVSDGGDSADLVERATGGTAVVLADGQGSGAAAKALSLAAVNRVAALLREGTRAEAALAAASDALVAARGGKVSVAIDAAATDPGGDLVLARLSTAPAYWRAAEADWMVLAPSVEPAGRYPAQIPDLHQLPLAPGAALVLVSDGIPSAGQRAGRPFDPAAWLAAHADAAGDDLAGALLAAALEADQGRPGDDLTVVAVLAVEERDAPRIRRVVASGHRR